MVNNLDDLLFVLFLLSLAAMIVYILTTAMAISWYSMLIIHFLQRAY